MAKNKQVLVSPQKIREVIKNWINETDVKMIEDIYQNYFNKKVYFSSEFELFEMPTEEAIRVGILCNKTNTINV